MLGVAQRFLPSLLRLTRVDHFIPSSALFSVTYTAHLWYGAQYMVQRASWATQFAKLLAIILGIIYDFMVQY